MDQFPGELLGAAFKDCVLEIRGGDDLQGFPMSAKHNTNKRVRPLLSKGDTGYRCRRRGVRRRKSVRGSVVSDEISVLSLCLVKIGENTVIEGLTDCKRSHTHIPRKDSKLRELFGVPDGEETVSFIKNLFIAQAGGKFVKMPKIKPTSVWTKDMMDNMINGRKKREAKRVAMSEEWKQYREKYQLIN